MVQTNVLADRCANIAKRICAYAGPVRKIAKERFSYAYSTEQWLQEGQVAAFLAFVEFNGDQERPEQFDWTSREYFHRALSIFQLYVIGSSSDIYDTIIRERTRRAGDDVGELSWDSWQGSFAYNEVKAECGWSAKRSGHRHIRDKARQHYDACWEQPNRVELGEELVLELTRLLRPQEAVWLIRRYRDGATTALLADELVAKDPRYQTADGHIRAVRYIDVVVHRAKKKCRAKLPRRWQMLSQEVA